MKHKTISKWICPRCPPSLPTNTLLNSRFQSSFSWKLVSRLGYFKFLILASLASCTFYGYCENNEFFWSSIIPYNAMKNYGYFHGYWKKWRNHYRSSLDSEISDILSVILIFGGHNMAKLYLCDNVNNITLAITCYCRINITRMPNGKSSSLGRGQH